MKNYTFSILFFFLGSQALACSELGRQEFKLDSKVGAACAEMAQKLALQIGNTTFSSLKKGDNAETAPHSPFKPLGLEPHAKLSTSPSETSEKKNGIERRVIFPATISTKQGKWECLYCVTFEIVQDKCVFKLAQMNHCAGGVTY